MSEQNEPTGTPGHVHGMAASVHEHTTARGSTFPLLLFAVEYRDAKHIRLRALEPDGPDARLTGFRVADSLGANDVAEAILLAGQTIRYGETMHARPLRDRIARRGAARSGDSAAAAAANRMKPSRGGMRVTAPNIAAVRAALGGRRPQEAVGFTVEDLRRYGSSQEESSQTEAALRQFRDQQGLDPKTYYGQKLARMLVALAGEARPEVDLRVDYDAAPVDALPTLWEVYRPQRTDYVTRALDATAAPSYGVPGGE